MNFLLQNKHLQTKHRKVPVIWSSVFHPQYLPMVLISFFRRRKTTIENSGTIIPIGPLVKRAMKTYIGKRIDSRGFPLSAINSEKGIKSQDDEHTH